MWNPFKKNANPDPNKMGMLQKIAMKKLEKMSPAERQKMAQDMLKPENRYKVAQAMEMMKNPDRSRMNRLKWPRSRWDYRIFANKKDPREHCLRVFYFLFFFSSYIISSALVNRAMKISLYAS